MLTVGMHLMICIPRRGLVTMVFVLIGIQRGSRFRRGHGLAVRIGIRVVLVFHDFSPSVKRDRVPDLREDQALESWYPACSTAERTAVAGTAWLLRTVTVEVPPDTRSIWTSVTSSISPIAELTRDAHDPQVKPATPKLALMLPAAGTDSVLLSWGAQQAHPEDDVSVRVRLEEVPHMRVSKI